jgi:hypothetical protein
VVGETTTTANTTETTWYYVTPSLKDRVTAALADGVVLAAKYGLALALILGGSWLFFVEYLGVRQNAAKGAAAYGYIAEQLAKQKAPETK